MHLWFWVWFVLAATMMVAEVLSPGLLMLPFGVGAAAAALLEYFEPGSVAWQWVAFVGVSALLLVLLRRREGTRARPQ